MIQVVRLWLVLNTLSLSGCLLLCCGFSRGERATADSGESYEMLLQSSLGFSNPSNVDYLLGKLGISDTKSHSLMRGLQRYTLFFFFFFLVGTNLDTIYAAYIYIFYLFVVNISLKMILQVQFGRSSLLPGHWNGMHDMHLIHVFILSIIYIL